MSPNSAASQAPALEVVSAVSAIPGTPAFPNDALITVAASVNTGDLDTIESYVEEVSVVLQDHYDYYELLLVDNGSSGGVAARIETLQKRIPHVRLLRLSRSHVEDVVFGAALDHSIGDVVVLMDLHRDPPALISVLVDACVVGNDAALGTVDRLDLPFLRRCGALAGRRISRLMTGAWTDPRLTSFRALNRRVVNAVIKSGVRHRAFSDVLDHVGYTQARVEYTQIDRGESGRQGHQGRPRSPRRGISSVLSSSTRPLRLAALLGIVASAVNLLNVVLAPRVPSANPGGAVLFLLLFVVLGLLSEYVARLLDQRSEGAPYHVVSESTSSVIDQYREKLNVV